MAVTLLVTGALLIALPAPVSASSGGSAATTPVHATLRPVVMDGTTTGILAGQLDLPVSLGSHGRYDLAGVSTATADGTGNGRNQRDLPAGPVDGVLMDPTTGQPQAAPGRGIALGASSQVSTRTPNGLSVDSTLNHLALTLDGFNPQAASVFGFTDLVTVDRLRTTGAAGVQGAPSVATQVRGLKIFGQTIVTPNEVLAAPVSRSRTTVVTDVVALLRALGVPEADIATYRNLLTSARLELTMTVTVSPVAAGGLDVRIAVFGTASATAGFAGKANLTTVGDTTMLQARFGAVQVATPSAMTPVIDALSPVPAEPGDTATVHGHGFTSGAMVVVAGVEVTPETIAADGTSLTFVVPSGASGTLPVQVRAAGGTTAEFALPIGPVDPFTAQPSDVLVAAGSAVEFTASATTSPFVPTGWQIRRAGEGWTDLPASGTPLRLVLDRSHHQARVRAVFAQSAGQLVTVAARVWVLDTPTLTGEPVRGGTVRAEAYDDSGLRVSYQWLRDGRTIGGATANAHVVTAQDEGHALRVRRIVRVSGHERVHATSAELSILPPVPTVVRPPGIVGTAQVGQTVRLVPGAWSSPPAFTRIEWLVAGTPVPGATGPSFTPRPADLAQQLQVRVTASTPGGSDVQAISAAVKVAPGHLRARRSWTVTGKALTGRVLRVARVRYQVPTAVRYEWLVAGRPVGHRATLRVTARHVGRKVRLRVRVTAPGYRTLTITTSAVKVRR